jgi:hypothetical protein
MRISPSFLEKAIVLRNQQHDAHQFLRPPPMPILINNGLRNIVFPLSNGDSTVLELVALFDTCGSLNSGDLSFHLWLAASYPDIVHEILFDDGPQWFDPIKLMGAVKESENTPEKHGILTAVIRYKTPFVDSSGAPMLLSFALGLSVSTDTILGWPSMLALGLSFDIHRFKIFSHVLNHEFHVLQDAGHLGIPVGVHFDLHDFRQRHDAAKTMTSIKSVPQSHGHAASSAYESIDSYDQGYHLCRKLQPKSQQARRLRIGSGSLDEDFIRDVSVRIDVSPDMITSNYNDAVCKSYPTFVPGAPFKPCSYIIQTPPKVWRHRPKNTYVPSNDYGSELDDDLFIFPRFGKSLRRPERVREVPLPTDIRMWNPDTDQDEFDKMFAIPVMLDPQLCTELVAVLQDNWDCFFSEGVR